MLIHMKRMLKQQWSIVCVQLLWTIYNIPKKKTWFQEHERQKNILETVRSNIRKRECSWNCKIQYKTKNLQSLVIAYVKIYQREKVSYVCDHLAAWLIAKESFIHSWSFI